MKLDFKRYGNTFPVKPLLEEFLIPVSKIEPLILEIYKEELQDAIMFIKSVQNKSQRLDVELSYGKISIQNNIRHLENKILDYKFILELEKRLDSVK